MKKKQSPKKEFVAKETSREYFRRFLAAADAVAVEQLLDNGILTNQDREPDAYSDAIDDLAVMFCGPFERTDLDNVVHFTAALAHREAAHMVGLALGLRLRGADLTGLIGGAR